MTAASYEVLVHAGAHCCGAEDFQRFLGANRAALKASDIDLAYPGRTGAPGGTFDCALPEPRHEGAEIEAIAGKVAATLAPAFEGGRRMILSEHDLAGRMANLLGGRFYPAARKRAEALREALDQPVEHLVMTVIPYDELFVAAWRRFALDRLMEPFAEYAPAMATFTGGWVDTIEAMRDALGARQVTILATRPSPKELLTHLAPALRLQEPALPAPMPVITDSAIAMIQRHYRQSARFAPGQRERILAFHARQPQAAVEHGFAGLQLADLKGRYVADIDTLARMQGVTVVGNFMPAMAAE
ncbi:hypothetical protein DEA8626_01892 [Defluviimonas aquaemixtae]|uniref:Uncharacterized protein n=1 Tax=Albidovulum aquaemixtae TaxID=1542388 RepID=A0A2R8B6T1_9RHOB|nr:hypothetical protein [Defluviimonas aquaemixtae]SPH18355.1 hypothetical protein DEA8626_01892 [Defluviimonas aquaemixtae]